MNLAAGLLRSLGGRALRGVRHAVPRSFDEGCVVRNAGAVERMNAVKQGSSEPFRLRRHVLISVHVPKTGGRSFKAVLEHHYGDAFFPDHPWDQKRSFIRRGSKPLNWVADWRDLRGIGCIHGHFDYKKYRALRFSPLVAPRFITWLRHPVERALSTYYFLRRLGTPPERRADYETDALNQEPEQYFRKWARNEMSRQLAGARLSSFDFVGIAEHYEDSIDLFYRDIIGADGERAEVPHHHRNPTRPAAGYDVSPSLRRKIEAANPDDLRLYDDARRLFDRRR